ncbi:MAG: ATP-binding cassette domain-containing protein [Candidatus Lokiarchaeota archaeon]|nr:ATP-binding cassette domain-containing protein [Candidatus Lokiarchaeota archaeon]MBD3337743.1 ATP-binding cassette domain-containing protein [Candidatus Lokiarchaeota archaeon]
MISSKTNDFPNFEQDLQIIVDNAFKTYQTGDIEIKALNSISLEIKKGAFKMILGPSGCGKTTLLNVIGGLDSPDSGEIFINFDDKFEEITKFSKERLTQYRRKRVGVIFQFYNLIPILTALENVELAARFSNIKNPRKKSIKYLEDFGLETKLDNFPNQLSGGEQQRVAIARALVKDPLLILADEPTGNLDTKKSNEIYKLLKDLSTDYGKTVLIVTHDEDMADKYAEEHILIRDGKIFESKENARKKLYNKSQ